MLCSEKSFLIYIFDFAPKITVSAKRSESVSGLTDCAESVSALGLTDLSVRESETGLESELISVSAQA